MIVLIKSFFFQTKFFQNDNPRRTKEYSQTEQIILVIEVTVKNKINKFED